MTQTLTAFFDGEVLRLETPATLEPNTRYVLTIEPAVAAPPMNAWDVLESLTGSFDGLTDFAAQHDHYIYGTPKRDSEAS